MSHFNLKNNTTSNINLQQLFNNLGLDTENWMKYDKFSSQSAIGDLHSRIDRQGV